MQILSISQSISVLAVWYLGCAGQTLAQTGAAKLKQDWKLQATREIEDAHRRNYSPKGGFYRAQVRVLQETLDQARQEVVESEFKRICGTDVADFSGRDDEMDKNFDHVMMVALLERSIGRRDTQHLQTLLSHHCPRYVVYCPLEFYLAYEWPGSIEHLFTCSVSAKAPAARKDAIFCLGRAFPSLRQRFSADSEFVHQAQSWYAANHSNLQFNTNYGYLPALPPPSGEDRTNLFIYKSK